MAICGIRDCENEVTHLGMCHKHWKRTRLYGSPFALKAHKIDVKGVDPSAYRAMVGMLPKPGSQHQRPVPLAMDRANADSLHSMFPALSRISHS